MSESPIITAAFSGSSGSPNPHPSTTINVTTPQEGQIVPVYKQGEEGAQIQTNFRMDLTQDHLTSIAVTEAEKQIRNRLATLNKAHAIALANAKSEEQFRTTYLEQWAERENATDQSFLPLLQALKPYVGKILSPSFSVASYDSRKNRLTANFFLQKDQVSISHTYEGVPSKEFLDSLETSKKLTKEMAQLSNDILGVRAALNNVDAIERYAKSNLAAQMAERSGEMGKALVDGIKASVDLDSIVEQFKY